MHERDDITELLNAAQAGDSEAGAAVYALIYAELKSRARRQARGHASTLSPTALVNETYVRLCERQHSPVRSRDHFYALAARAMRQIVVDHARRRGAAKRGGGALHTDLDAELGLGDATAQSVLELDNALTALHARDEKLGQLVELHFFGGLSFQELADRYSVHERTVRRDWELARAFLKRAMGEGATA